MPALALLWPSDIGLRPDGEQVTCVFVLEPSTIHTFSFSFVSCSFFYSTRVCLTAGERGGDKKIILVYWSLCY